MTYKTILDTLDHPRFYQLKILIRTQELQCSQELLPHYLEPILSGTDFPWQLDVEAVFYHLRSSAEERLVNDLCSATLLWIDERLTGKKGRNTVRWTSTYHTSGWCFQMMEVIKTVAWYRSTLWIMKYKQPHSNHFRVGIEPLFFWWAQDHTSQARTKQPQGSSMKKIESLSHSPLIDPGEI